MSTYYIILYIIYIIIIYNIIIIYIIYYIYYYYILSALLLTQNVIFLRNGVDKNIKSEEDKISISPWGLFLLQLTLNISEGPVL